MSIETPPDSRGPQNTPLWMDVSGTHEPSVARRGVAPAPRAGLHTLLFFGLIVVAVGAAGLIGVAVWGPEKPITSGSHLASQPPPPSAVMPSLPAAAESAAEPAPPPPVESAAPVKKAKRTVAAPKSKHR